MEEIFSLYYTAVKLFNCVKGFIKYLKHAQL